MNSSFDQLVRVLSRLPGVGRRTAERMALKLAQQPGTLSHDLTDALQRVKDNVCTCQRCGNLTEHDADPCSLCRNPNRDARFLCLVEEPGDLKLLEQSGEFNGLYFCLMGKLSPMQGDNLDNPRLKKLIERIREDRVQEILLALNSDVESQATAHYLAELLSGLEIKITRLALGIPAGSGISYSDSVTLSRAIEGRQAL